MSPERLKIPYPVIVEGKYDKLRISAVAEAEIITTDGFGIFKNNEKKALLRALAKKTPLIVLTDPDGAGGVIRSHIDSIIPKDRIIRLYVPQIAGKEKRKSEPSAEGVLGVEGMAPSLLRDLLAPYAADALPNRNTLSAADLFRDGLTGCPGSSARRDAVCDKLGLPRGMNAKALLCAMRYLLSDGEYSSMIENQYRR